MGDYNYTEPTEVKENNDNFGLTIVKLKNLEYKKTDTYESINLIFSSASRDYYLRIFSIEKVYDNNNNLLEKSNPDYQIYSQKRRENIFGIVNDILKSYGYTVNEIRKSFSNIDSFENFANKFIELIPKDYKNIKLHTILQWQWNIQPNQNSTFLEISKNYRHGKIFNKFLEGKWEPVKEWITKNEDEEIKKEGLAYKNKNNEIHPLTRSKWFLLSKFGNQQTKQKTGEYNEDINKSQSNDDNLPF